MTYDCAEFSMSTESQGGYHQYPHVKVELKGEPSNRLLGLFEGTAGREFTRLEPVDYMQPLRAKKLVALYEAGAEYRPKSFGHYFRLPDGKTVTPGKALAMSGKK